MGGFAVMNGKTIPALISAITCLVILFSGCGNDLTESISGDVEEANTISAPAVTGTAVTNDTAPIWTWTPVPDAEFYRFGFSEGEWIEAFSEELSYTPSAPLAEGSYTLYVQAGKGANVWSDSASFTISIDLTPPEAPVVTGISLTNDTTPQWTWNTNNDAAVYRYGFSEGAWISQDSEAVSFTPSSVMDEGIYTLYVQARDAVGNWSSSGSFSITIDLTAPTISGLVSSSEPVLSVTWNWDSDETSVEYRFIVNQVPDPVSDWSAASWGGVQTYTLEGVTGTYYLHIQVKDALETVSSEITVSAVLDNTPPDSPTVSGTDTTANSNPEWTWNVPADTNSFRYQTDSESEDGWMEVAGLVTSYQPSGDDLLSEGDHTLYVQAADDLGNWSASGSKTTIVFLDPPETPDPADGSVLMELTPMLTWEDVGYASAYRIQVNTAEDFSGTMIDDDSEVWGPDEYQIPGGLDSGGEYFWRVKARNTEGIWGATWSSVWSFSIRETWALSLGGTGTETINSIIETSGGNFVLAGNNSTYESNGDMWIAKTDPLGQVLWEKNLGTADDSDSASMIRETSDSGFIVAGSGVFSSVNWYDHPWIVKLDSSGAVEWERLISGIYDEKIYSITETSDGGYVACGYTPNFSADSDDAWIFKLDSELALEWANLYGGSAGGYDYTYSVVQTTDGGFIAAGSTGSFTTGLGDEAWIMKLASDGSVSWAKCFGRTSDAWTDVFYDVKQINVDEKNPDGGYIAVGISRLSSGYYDILAMKLELDGDLVWIRSLGLGSYTEYGYSVLQTSEGDFMLTGSEERTISPYDYNPLMVKLSSSGDSILWQKLFEGTGDDGANAVSMTSSGGFILAGYTNSYGAGGYDGWIIRIDSSGDCGSLDSDAGVDFSDSGDNSDFTVTVASVTVTDMTGDGDLALTDTASASVETSSSSASVYQVPEP